MEREIPVYVDLNSGDFSIKYNAIPKLTDIPYPVEMEVNLVVEFYSR
jgi:small subunit ribosomal protein S4